MSERWMIDSEWDACWATLAGLWPKQAKAMGAEEPDQWRASLGKFPQAVVQDAMKAIYPRAKFFPKLGEVVFACQERQQARGATPEAAEARKRAMEDEAERCDRAWADVREFIANTSDADLRGHQRMIVASSPTFAFVARQNPRVSKGLQSQILARVKRGWGPDERVGICGRHTPTTIEFYDVTITHAMLAAADVLMKAAGASLPGNPVAALTVLLPKAITDDRALELFRASAAKVLEATP